MLSVEDKTNIIELLSGLSEDDLMSLASTVTKGLFKPDTREEAYEVILQHSENVESILNRQKVSRELIFAYLHWKKVSAGSNLDKKSMLNQLVVFWREQQHTGTTSEETQNHTIQNSTTRPNNQRANRTSREVVAVGLEPGQVDLLAHKFTEWFYHVVNKDFLEGGNFALDSEHFWSDASLHMQLRSNGEEVTEDAEGSQNVVAMINETKQKHKLYFSPNLSAEGVRGRSEPHGMVSVLVCGTLHQSAGVIVGLFEQIFYLIKDPLTNNTWKIKRTQLALTSQKNIAAMPILSEGRLTRSLLPIENPD